MRWRIQGSWTDENGHTRYTVQTEDTFPTREPGDSPFARIRHHVAEVDRADDAQLVAAAPALFQALECLLAEVQKYRAKTPETYEQEEFESACYGAECALADAKKK